MEQFGISRAHARQLTLSNLNYCIDRCLVLGLRSKRSGFYYKISKETAQKEHDEFFESKQT